MSRASGTGQAYTTAPRTFDRWTRGITTTDFKPLFPTQIGNFPGLLPVMEGAEFSYGTIAESRETYRLATFGRIVALTQAGPSSMTICAPLTGRLARRA